MARAYPQEIDCPRCGIGTAKRHCEIAQCNWYFHDVCEHVIALTRLRGTQAHLHYRRWRRPKEPKDD